MRDWKEAVEYLTKEGIKFYGINVNPDQHTWSESNKQYAHIYIDDAAFGCPLRDHPCATSNKKCVDWSIVGPAVMEKIEEIYGK